MNFDNDALIFQAQQLYAALLAKQFKSNLEDNHKSELQLGRLIVCAYCRYQRRLNKCVLCYQYRKDDCNREPGIYHSPCKRYERLLINAG